MGSEFGTAEASEPHYLLQSTVGAFLSEAPKGHCSVGFWGHGMNSHAFYYLRRESWCSLYLRRAYGGCFEDNARAAQDIRATMAWYAGFLPLVQLRARHCLVVDSMGAGQFRIVRQDGQVIEGRGPLFERGRGAAPELRPMLAGA